MREIARLNRAIDKVVVSDSLKLQPMSPWSDARVVRRAEAWEFVTRLKADVGKDILVFGSRLTRNGLMADGLVDELHLMIGGVILGTGVPAFGQSGPGPPRLINQHRWSASDNVLLQSACAERS